MENQMEASVASTCSRVEMEAMNSEMAWNLVIMTRRKPSPAKTKELLVLFWNKKSPTWSRNYKILSDK